MDASDAGAGAGPSAAEATSTRDDTERKWHPPPRVSLAMALSLSSPAVVSLSRRSLFLGLQKKMGRAYFSVYWTYITVQLVFIRPDLILIQRSEVSQRCTVNEIPATPDEEKQQPLLHS
jgi:hypothetical protein